MGAGLTDRLLSKPHTCWWLQLGGDWFESDEPTAPSGVCLQPLRVLCSVHIGTNY